VAAAGLDGPIRVRLPQCGIAAGLTIYGKSERSGIDRETLRRMAISSIETDAGSTVIRSRFPASARRRRNGEHSTARHLGRRW